MASGSFSRCLAPLLIVTACQLMWQPARAAGTTGFDGGWQVIDPPTLLHTATGALPPLLPAAKTVYERNIAERARNNLDFDGLQKCLPPGVPRIFLLPTPFKIVAGGTTVGLFFQWNHAIRLIHLNQPHYDPIGPAYYGQSVGGWQGDTLVVDTNDFNDVTLLDDALPHSAAFHLVERLRLISGGRVLEDRFTIEDPKIFSHAWSFALDFRKLPDPTILAEDYCLRRTGMLGAK